MSPPRNDIETTSVATDARCPHCDASFRRIRRQRFCSPACRQAAWRARHHNPAPAAGEAMPLVPTRRKDITVYACPDCEERYLGQQWCHDCNRPCTRVGIGGACPGCDQPVAIDDLVAQHEDQTTQTAKIR